MIDYNGVIEFLFNRHDIDMDYKDYRTRVEKLIQHLYRYMEMTH